MGARYGEVAGERSFGANLDGGGRSRHRLFGRDCLDQGVLIRCDSSYEFRQTVFSGECEEDSRLGTGSNGC